MSIAEKYTDRINKLLRKAESTTPEEADALFSKAQELMTSYSITESMLANAAGAEMKKEEIIKETVKFTGIYQKVLMLMGHYVGQTNSCRTLYTNVDWERPKAHKLTLIGFESDVRNAKLLVSSLEIQVLSSLNTWWRQARETYNYHSKMEQYKARRQFIVSFSATVYDRLAEAVKAGREEATTEHATRTNISATAASDSVALVLRTKKEQVDDWMDKNYGRLRNGRGSSFHHGGATASQAGRAAGASANLGGTGLNGGAGRLGSGS